MADDSISPELSNVIGTTIDKLRGVVDNDKLLQEKHLAKPPFQYIQKLVEVVIKYTGFPNGLFTKDELEMKKPERDYKLLFLRKLIYIVSLSLGQEVACNPLYIAAGKEPENTNILLYLFAECAANASQLNWYAQVAYILQAEGGGGAAADNSAAAASYQYQAEEQEALRRYQEQYRAAAAEYQKKAEEQERRRQQQAAAAEEQRRRYEQAKLQQEYQLLYQYEYQARYRYEYSAYYQPAAATAQQMRPSSAAKRPMSAKKGPPRPKSNVVDANADAAASGSSSRPDSGKTRATAADSDQQYAGASQAELDRGAASGVILADGDANDDDDGGAIIIDNSGPKRGTAAYGGNRYMGQLMENLMQNRYELASKNELEAKEGADGDATRSYRPGSGRSGIILKKKGSAGKDQEGPGQQEKEKDTMVNIQGELDQLRQNIYTITRSTNPIGKNMGYIQEDLDTINKEFEKWRLLAQQEEMKLQEEKIVTEQYLKTLQSNLLELEYQAQDKIEKINNVKANILKNDMVLEKLLRTVTSS